ncbi:MULTISPECIES: hypothetical protein [Streptomyces]|uniref:hypothetical protein n=1 Tax=Streptomyces TaxID=1883 RepID=UPI00211A0FA6|nr:hypothetical protein [Streptomyces hilarionis]MCQ9133166.1 hypothetical protein [Streptomyces hilarionis]
MEIVALPRVDEHATVVAAEAAEVWRALGAVLERSFAEARWARYARLVGAAERSASGAGPLTAGSTLAGFRVTEAVAGRRLVLVGGHRFSSYALVFRLGEAGPGGTRLSAETRAVFPGRAGGLYRRLVIGSGGHGVVVRRMLAKVRRRAETRRSGR